MSKLTDNAVRLNSESMAANLDRAEKMARGMIVLCALNDVGMCSVCTIFDNKTCPARLYLAEVCHDPKAWEIHEQAKHD